MKILLFSDTHLIHKYSVFNENIEAIIKFINEGYFDFALHLGDVAAEAASHPEQLRFAADSHKPIKTPVYFLPGNHDVGDNPVATRQLGEPLLKLERLEEFRTLFGADRFSLQGDGWHVVGLNSQLFGSGTEAEEEQFAWLEEVFALGTGALGLCLHKPLIRHEDTVGPDVRYIPDVARERLLGLCTGRDLKFVASGHVHQRRQFRLGGVEHIWVPSTSFCIPEAMQASVGEKVVGVTVLDLRKDRTFLVTPCEIEGLVRHNLLDHPEIYPVAVAKMRDRLGDAASVLEN